MRVIYLDVLVLINFYVTFFIIKGSCCILRQKPPDKRVLLGALAGGLSSLVILLPDLGYIFSWSVKLGMGAIITLLVFGVDHGKKRRVDLRRFLKYIVVFLLVNFAFAGLMTALWTFSAPLGMVYNNGTVYFDISLPAILIITAAAYLVLKLIRFAADSRAVFEREYEIEVTEGGKSIVLNAFPDSGNMLSDFFTGLPVIMCDYDKMSGIAPEGVKAMLELSDIKDGFSFQKGVRVIPLSTVSGSRLAIAFRPEKIMLRDGEEQREISALIGFASKARQQKEAIFNPKKFI